MSEGAPEASKLVDVLQRVCLHDHLCLIYEGPQEQLTVPILSIRLGLERGEKCFYIPDDSARSDVVAALQAAGVDVEAAMESGRLTIASRRDTYLRDGYFQPDSMIRIFSETLGTTNSPSFSGLRVVGEMTWALEGRPGTEKLMEYEATLNQFVRDHPAVVTCQYDRTRFPPEVILNAIRTHPIVVYGKLVCINPYYVPPEEFLSPNHPEMEVERLLSNILDRERAQAELRNVNERLHSLSRQLLDVQERERRWIARELHDEIGQMLTAAKLNLQAAKDLTDSVSINELLGQSISSLSRLLESNAFLGHFRASKGDELSGFIAI